MTDAAFEVRELTLDEIRSVYHRYLIYDFPDDERKPLFMIERAHARGRYRCFGAVKGGEILAYAFFAGLIHEGKRLLLLDYLAVREDIRDRGVGGAFLSSLRSGPLIGADMVLVEADDPDFARDGEDKATRLRRLRFYFRCGLLDTGVRSLLYGVRYAILEMPLSAAHTQAEAFAAYETLYHSILPPWIYKKQVAVSIKETDRHAGEI